VVVEEEELELELELGMSQNLCKTVKT